MKPSDDVYTIMIFRGATANPRRLKIRKVTVRRMIIATICLAILQVGILAHYVVQFAQVTELKVLREQVSQSKGQTSAFSSAIDEMREKMTAMQQLNRKLQTMFGLEPDPLETTPDLNGQGGEEIPFETLLPSQTGNVFIDKITGSSKVAEDLNTRAGHITRIKSGLFWLNNNVGREEQILAKLEETAGKRVERWASTPSIWPVKGPITSRFGPRISPFTGKKAFHSGLDIGSPRGTEIRAPAAGKVVIAAYDTRMGKFIRIDHGFGIETTYGHLSKVLVKYGKKVKRGDLIGLVGNTGKFSTGPHLHYQIALNDKVVNPVQYILD